MVDVEATMTLGAVKRQAQRYLVAVYGEEHTELSTPDNIATYAIARWMKAVADGNVRAAERIMALLEEQVRVSRATTVPGEEGH